MSERIEKFLLSGSHGDSIRYSYERDKYMKFEGEIDAENQWSYIVEILVITIKSLMPSNQSVGSYIDYERFDKELKLWTLYKHGDNNRLRNISNNSSDLSYWKEIDDSIYSRIVPIVFVNEEWEIAKQEVIKNVLYTTGKIENLLEAIILSKLLYEVLNDKDLDYEKILEDMKAEIIQFSQKELLQKYKDSYRLGIGTYPDNFIVDFERTRIGLLNNLNGIIENDKYIVVSESLKLLKGDALGDKDIFKNFFLDGLAGLLTKQNEEYKIKDKFFIESMSMYLYKLKKGRISPESLEVSNYHLPDIFKFDEGEEFQHTLLKKCKVINKREINMNIVSYVSTRMGIYRFFCKSN